MQVLILIEPIEEGRFRARAGEPFGVSAEGETGKKRPADWKPFSATASTTEATLLFSIWATIYLRRTRLLFT